MTRSRQRRAIFKYIFSFQFVDDIVSWFWFSINAQLHNIAWWQYWPDIDPSMMKILTRYWPFNDENIDPSILNISLLDQVSISHYFQMLSQYLLFRKCFWTWVLTTVDTVSEQSVKIIIAKKPSATIKMLQSIPCPCWICWICFLFWVVQLWLCPAVFGLHCARG